MSATVSTIREFKQEKFFSNEQELEVIPQLKVILGITDSHSDWVFFIHIGTVRMYLDLVAISLFLEPFFKFSAVY